MSNAFDAAMLERRYAFLDACPEVLFERVVTLPLGTLEERVQGVLAWRAALLEGHLPRPGAWVPPAIALPVFSALEQLNIARFCRGQTELVDSILRDVLAALERTSAQLRADVLRELVALEQLARQRLLASEVELAAREKRPPRAVSLTASQREALRRQAELQAERAQRPNDKVLTESWEPRVRCWAAIAEVFGDLGALFGRGWDFTQGILRHTSWTNVLKLQALLEKLPQLREVIRSLGRLHLSKDAPSVAEQLMQPISRLVEELREIPTPHVPAETRGVERSGELARMLPAESVLLGHPKLRLLWHARRAERALLTYRVEGLEWDRTLVEQVVHEQVSGRRASLERGPVIVIVDTSGSMSGTPEAIAKALVLEAARTAHKEKRRCFLFSYSGPGQIAEHELTFSEDGIGRLLTFLGLTFGGGNDELGVLARVAARLAEENWKKADVLFVSDGEWPATPSLDTMTAPAREKGTRFHGVQIGNQGRTGLHSVCDPVHVFRDWAALANWT